MARYPIGQPVRESTTVRQLGLDGTYSLVNADAITLTVQKPDGTQQVYTSPVNDGPGLYHQDLPVTDLTQVGHYQLVWTSTGTGAGAQPGSFDVYDPFAGPAAFASPGQAEAYGYALPDGTADGLLARATQAIRDEAGIPLTLTSSVLTLPASCGKITLPCGLVAAVTEVTVSGGELDGETVTGYEWRSGPEIILGCGVLPAAARWQDWFTVSFSHGFAALPAALVRLTCAVAMRLSVTPAAALAGITSRTVGGVSWAARAGTAGNAVTEGLTPAERRQLGRIVPLPAAWNTPF